MAKTIPVSGYAVSHGRTLFTNTICKSKRNAISAYVSGCDKGWTWKRLYAAGARVNRIKGRLHIIGKKP
jgi:hypothetical protein